jgi:hypothetical protein
MLHVDYDCKHADNVKYADVLAVQFTKIGLGVSFYYFNSTGGF